MLVGYIPIDILSFIIISKSWKYYLVALSKLIGTYWVVMDAPKFSGYDLLQNGPEHRIVSNSTWRVYDICFQGHLKYGCFYEKTNIAYTHKIFKNWKKGWHRFRKRKHFIIAYTRYSGKHFIIAYTRYSGYKP